MLQGKLVSRKGINILLLNLLLAESRKRRFLRRVSSLMAGPEYELGAPVPLRERLRRIYRGTLFQAIIIGLVSFSQPGIWGALNSESTG